MKEQIPGLRILLVVPYTKPDYSGSGINAFNFARFLIREGEKVRILTFNRNLRLRRLEKIQSVPIHRILYFNRNIFTKILSILLIFPAYIYEILRHDVIIIYGGHIIGYELLIKFGRFLGRKVVFQSLLLGEDDIESIVHSKPEISRQFYRALFRKVHLYHAINPQFANRFIRLTGKESSCLLAPQGYDPEFFYPISPEQRLELRTKNKIPEDKLVFLSAGFLIPRKGYMELFAALSQLDIDYVLYIIGEFDFTPGHFLFPYARDSEEIIEAGKHLLGKKMVLKGPVMNVNEYMQTADIFLLHSQNEGLPNVLLEAMACGCSVLSCNLPGLQNYIIRHDSTGLVYNNKEDFKVMISNLAVSPETRDRLGSNAARFIIQFASFGFTWQKLKKSLNVSF